MCSQARQGCQSPRHEHELSHHRAKLVKTVIILSSGFLSSSLSGISYHKRWTTSFLGFHVPYLDWLELRSSQVPYSLLAGVLPGPAPVSGAVAAESSGHHQAHFHPHAGGISWNISLLQLWTGQKRHGLQTTGELGWSDRQDSAELPPPTPG